MESLKRKPSLDVRKTMNLTDGTEIKVIGLTARKSMQITNNKSLSDADRAVHQTAAKILVNGNPIVPDDLLDCFSDLELIEIIKFANDITDEQLKNV